MKINLTAFAGIGIAVAIVYFGVLHTAKNPVMFLDTHAILLVLGGTLAAALIAFPAGKLYALLDFLILGMLFPSKKEMIKVADELLFLNSLYKLEPQSLKNAEYSHPFVREVVGLLTETNMTEHEFKNVLVLRSKNILKSYQADSKMLNALAKFPPAFGLLGATTGMIEMMSNLGKGGASSIGSAMAIALVATFWGIAMANFVFLPLADRAGKMAVDDAHIRDMIIEAAMVIKNKGSEYLLLNTLRGFLPLTQRNSVSVYNNYAQSPYVAAAPPVVKTAAQKASDAAMEKWGNKVKTHKPQKMNLQPVQDEYEEVEVGEDHNEVQAKLQEHAKVYSMENTLPPEPPKNVMGKQVDFSQLRPKQNQKNFKKAR